MSQSHPNYVTNALGEFAFAGATGQGRLFRKEVIRAGTYQHPVNPWPEALDADRAYLERVALNTNEAIARGIQVPIPDTHNDKPEDNKGYVRRAFVDEVDGEPALFIDAEIIDPETLPKVGNSWFRSSAR